MILNLHYFQARWYCTLSLCMGSSSSELVSLGPLFCSKHSGSLCVFVVAVYGASRETYKG